MTEATTEFVQIMHGIIENLHGPTKAVRVELPAKKFESWARVLFLSGQNVLEGTDIKYVQKVPDGIRPNLEKVGLLTVGIGKIKGTEELAARIKVSEVEGRLIARTFGLDVTIPASDFKLEELVMTLKNNNEREIGLRTIRSNPEEVKGVKVAEIVEKQLEGDAIMDKMHGFFTEQLEANGIKLKSRKDRGLEAQIRDTGVIEMILRAE